MEEDNFVQINLDGSCRYHPTPFESFLADIIGKKDVCITACEKAVAAFDQLIFRRGEDAYGYMVGGKDFVSYFSRQGIEEVSEQELIDMYFDVTRYMPYHNPRKHTIGDGLKDAEWSFLSAHSTWKRSGKWPD